MSSTNISNSIKIIFSVGIFTISISLMCIFPSHCRSSSFYFIFPTLDTSQFCKSVFHRSHPWYHLPGKNNVWWQFKSWWQYFGDKMYFQCISIDKTKDFEVNYDTIPVNEKLRARDELINLYSSQSILIYLIFSIFHILLLCCSIFYILINTTVFYGEFDNQLTWLWISDGISD